MRAELLLIAILAGCVSRPSAPMELRTHPPETGPVEPASSTRDPLPTMSDQELHTRLDFVEEVVARNAHHTRLWFGFFTELYAAGAVVQSGRAVIDDDPANRAEEAFSAAKAAVGVVARMAHPPRAVFGATPDELYPGDSHAALARRLVAAERMLRRDAQQNDNRYSWIGHTLNLALNLAGFLFVCIGYHDWALASESCAVGFLVGETSIWMQPWTAKSGMRAYRRRWGGLAIDGPTRVGFTF